MPNEPMTLDLARPEHRDALKWACELWQNRADVAKQYAVFSGPGDAADPLGIAACRALSSPSDSAGVCPSGG